MVRWKATIFLFQISSIPRTFKRVWKTREYDYITSWMGPWPLERCRRSKDQNAVAKCRTKIWFKIWFQLKFLLLELISNGKLLHTGNNYFMNSAAIPRTIEVIERSQCHRKFQKQKYESRSDSSLNFSFQLLIFMENDKNENDIYLEENNWLFFTFSPKPSKYWQHKIIKIPMKIGWISSIF